MKAEFFKAVCPLEIGDTVAIKATKDGETKEALYLPQGCTRSQTLQRFTI